MPCFNQHGRHTECIFAAVKMSILDRNFEISFDLQIKMILPPCFYCIPLLGKHAHMQYDDAISKKMM